VACLAGAILSDIIVIQIERQIILSIHPTRWLFIFRGCLAFLMALLGAVIIDQILFEKDIELEKISYISSRIDKLLPEKTAELRNQIMKLDTTISIKEAEKKDYIKDVRKNPTISLKTTQTHSIPTSFKGTDIFGRDSIRVITSRSTSTTTNSILNPTLSFIQSIDSTISEMRNQKALKENQLLNIRSEMEKEMKEKIGFIDELKVMHRLITNSNVAFAFWLLWILFFLLIEMLVLVAKKGNKDSDYEKAVLHHMNLQIRKLDALSKEL
jgi:hypothetical protein